MLYLILLWKNMRNEGYNIGSLIYWAYSDNPIEYKEICKNNKNLVRKDFEELTSIHGISKYIKECYPNIYMSTNPSKNEWYEFIKTKWQNC